MKELKKPKNDIEIAQDLQRGQFPEELLEFFKIDPDAQNQDGVIKEALELAQRIANKLISDNKIDEKFRPKILIASSDEAGAHIFLEEQQPFLVINFEAISKCKTEDEIAGIIAYALDCLNINRNPNLKDVKNLGFAEYLLKSGYNIKGFNDWVKRDKNFITIHRQNPKWYAGEKQVMSVPREATEALETMLVGRIREQGISQKQNTINIPNPLFEKHFDYSSYKSPVRKFLEQKKYDEQNNAGKIRILKELVELHYSESKDKDSQSYSVEKVRFQEIAKLVKELKDVKLDKGTEERTMLDELYLLLLQPGPLNSRSKDLQESMKELWKNNVKPEDAEYFFPAQYYRDAVQNFINAKNHKDAEEFAKEIIKWKELIGDAEIATHPTRMEKIGIKEITENLLYRFKLRVQTRDEINSEISKNGFYKPPYLNLVKFYEDSKSENIKKVLDYMSLNQDPYVAQILGEEKKSLPVSFNNFRQQNFDGLVRDGNGVITPLLSEPLDLYRSETEEKQFLDSGKIRWDLLESDFNSFIYCYGPYLVPANSDSKTKRNYPFAEEFFRRVGDILQHENNDIFKKNIVNFMSIDPVADRYAGPFYTYGNLLSTYSTYPVSDSSMLEIKHPTIEFLEKEPGHSLIPDAKKYRFLCGNKKIGKKINDLRIDFSEINWRKYLKFPPEGSIVSVRDLCELKDVEPVVQIIEAEKFLAENKHNLSFEEIVSLDSFIRNNTDLNKISSVGEWFNSNIKYLKSSCLETSLRESDINSLIDNYKKFDASGWFGEFPKLQKEFFKILKEKISSVEDPKVRGEFIELWITKELPEFQPFYGKETRSSSWTYSGNIVDPEISNWAIKELSQYLERELGEDNGEQSYCDKVMLRLTTLCEKLSNQNTSALLVKLADQINAQKITSNLLRAMYGEHNGKVSHDEAGALTTIALINSEEVLSLTREEIITFLTNPLTPNSIDVIAQKLQTTKTFQFQRKEKEELDYVMENYHKAFWDKSIEEQSAYLSTIIFPKNSNDEQLKLKAKEIIDKYFSGDDANIKFARDVVNIYLSSIGDAAEIKLLASALVIANSKRFEGEKEISLGKKLGIVLSHLGPAGGKLLQAIHSNPNTPEGIRKDLGDSKTNFSPLKRWEVIGLLENEGLLDPTNKNYISHIGRVVGSGSFGITMFNKVGDDIVADTVLRPYAADRASREFGIIQKTAKEIINLYPALNFLPGIVEEAKKSAEIETDMDVARHQNESAEGSYDGVKVKVKHKGTTHEFTNNVVPFIVSGKGFKRCEIAKGLHFNDLPNDTKEEQNYRKALAKSMIATQITLRLSGKKTDIDRHGGNIKIQGHSINHFDFGMMTTQDVTHEQKQATGIILARVYRAMRRKENIGESFGKIFMDQVNNFDGSNSTKEYLSLFNKDLLALGDYINALTKPELVGIFARVLLSNNVDKTIRSSFNKELTGASRRILPSTHIEKMKLRLVQDRNVSVTTKG